MSLHASRSAPSASRRALGRVGWGLAALLATVTAGTYSFGTDTEGKRLQWALIDGDENVTSSTWSEEAWDTIKRLKSEDQKLFWFRLDDQDYVVTDHAGLDDVETAVRPMMELGKQQGRLGRMQGELGRKQGRLGREQGRIGALQGKLSARLATMAATNGHSAKRTELQRQIQELAEMQHDLAATQRPLAERQQELAIKQQDLAELQREARVEVARDLDRITARCIADGRAKPISE